MSQTQIVSAKTVSIVPQNGTEFSVTRGQKIIFEIDPSMGLIKGRDSYLALDVLNNSVDHQRLALDSSAGVDGLIARVDIYSLRTGKHLETMENYNQFMALSNQYFFEDKTNIQSLQGCGNKVFTQTWSDTDTNMQPVISNVNNVEDAILSPITSSGVPAYNFRRYITPLKCGVFRYWDDERLCPVMGFQGLRIELTLEDPRMCCHNMNATLTDGTVVDLIDRDGDGLSIELDGTDLTTTSDVSVGDCGLAVGNSVFLSYTLVGPQELTTTITSLTVSAGKVVIGIAAAVPAAGSVEIQIYLNNDTRALRIRPQFRLVQVAPTDMVIKEMSKGLNYSFTTYDYFVDSLIASVRKHLIEIIMKK